MRVFARYNLVHDNGSPDDELLLEGNWPPDKNRPRRRSLDDAIDARFIWIDRLAMELAERAGPSSADLSFAYINALALRYYLVKLLRVVAFFQHAQPVKKGGRLALHVATADGDYIELFEQIASAQQLELTLHCQRASLAPPAAARRPPRWRQWAAHASQRRRPAISGERNARPRVVLCGNPHILNPVCAELVSRGARVAWLYERFAVRSWWKWRATGVEQLICETGRPTQSSFNDVSCDESLMVEGVDLARPINHWLARRAQEVGDHQSLLVERVESHFRRIRPTAIVVDEDATPLKRIAVAVGRLHGAASLVVQHGAPCGPFGFLPLAADKIAVWGDAASRQLQRWGLSPERIHTAGWPLWRAGRVPVEIGESQVAPTLRGGEAIAKGDRPLRHGVSEPPYKPLRYGVSEPPYKPLRYGVSEPPYKPLRHGVSELPYKPLRHGVSELPYDHLRHGVSELPYNAKRFLLLATMPPRDERPDNVEFHLTSANHRDMLAMVYDVLSKIDGATLTIKPHPRDARPTTVPGPLWPIATDQGRRLPTKIVRTRELSKLIAQSDCVLNCASTAGIEAALAGAPVVQLLPAGSGEILPAADWGFVGSARTAQELASLVDEALSRGWRSDSQATAQILAGHGRAAAARIVDGALSTRCAREAG